MLHPMAPATRADWPWGIGSCDPKGDSPWGIARKWSLNMPNSHDLACPSSTVLHLPSKCVRSGMTHYRHTEASWQAEHSKLSDEIMPIMALPSFKKAHATCQLSHNLSLQYIAKQQISGLAANSCIWPSADQSLNSRSIPSMLLNAVWLVVEPPISKTFGTLNPQSHEDSIRTLKTYSVKTKQLSQLFVCSLLPLLDLRHEFPSSALKCKLEIQCRGMPHSCVPE